jgi:hypothetical protein
MHASSARRPAATTAALPGLLGGLLLGNVILAAEPPAAGPPPAEQRFAAIAPLIGHCWIAPIGDAGMRDVQCFERMYGESFVRNTHIVLGGKAPYEGTTIYSWDGEKQRLRYHYFTSTGAVSEGQVEGAGDTPVFIEAHTSISGNVTLLRSEVRYTGDRRGYTVQTRSASAAGDAPPAVRTYRRSDSSGQAAARAEVDGREWLLVWASERDGDWEIYREQPDGSAFNLTRSASAEWPYGVADEVLYLVSGARVEPEARGWRLARIGPAQQGIQRVHDRIVKDSLVSRHPDGKHLAATVLIDEVPQIVLLDAAGEIVETLSPAGVAESDPDFASDGRLLLRSRRSGAWELWLRSADGKHFRQLTRDPANDDVDDADYGGEGPAHFSPDGHSIVWQRRFADRDNDIWVMAADGSNARNLTADHAGNDSYPAFSPDGRWIAFSSDRQNDAEIWLMDADGSNPRRVTYAPGSDSQPMWVRSPRTND